MDPFLDLRPGPEHVWDKELSRWVFAEIIEGHWFDEEVDMWKKAF